MTKKYVSEETAPFYDSATGGKKILELLEIELIPEVQWHFTDSIFLKVNSAFGVTSKAVDWAPEIGVMSSFPVGG